MRCHPRRSRRDNGPGTGLLSQGFVVEAVYPAILPANLLARRVVPTRKDSAVSYTPVPDTPIASALLAMTRSRRAVRPCGPRHHGGPDSRAVVNAAPFLCFEYWHGGVWQARGRRTRIIFAVAQCVGTARTVAAAGAIADGLGLAIAGGVVQRTTTTESPKHDQADLQLELQGAARPPSTAWRALVHWVSGRSFHRSPVAAGGEYSDLLAARPGQPPVLPGAGR